MKRNSAAQGQLVAKTTYGDVHKVDGLHTQRPEDRHRTRRWSTRIRQKTGQNYVQSQKNLPDVIVVGGSGGGSGSPAGQGHGD